MSLASGAGNSGWSRTRPKLVCCEAWWLSSKRRKCRFDLKPEGKLNRSLTGKSGSAQGAMWWWENKTFLQKRVGVHINQKEVSPERSGAHQFSFFFFFFLRYLHSCTDNLLHFVFISYWLVIIIVNNLERPIHKRVQKNMFLLLAQLTNNIYFYTAENRFYACWVYISDNYTRPLFTEGASNYVDIFSSVHINIRRGSRGGSRGLQS